ncbi:type I-E CRISPR-associated protein Cse1/CasA [Streptomyces sp. NPDC001661]
MTAATLETGGDPPSFDLTTRPWIPVLGRDGTQQELSLRDVFERAGGLRRIAGDLPTQDFALLRLLLAVAHDALQGPADIDVWDELWADEDCFAPVAAYLDRHADRFDLLSPQAPFFQTPGLRTAKDEVFSLNRIVADVPNGEPFFSARLPAVDRLTFAEAARWTVHAHAYDTSGIKTGAAGDSRAKGGKVYPLGVGWTGNLGGVYVEGATLRETLLLNLVAADAANFDVDDDDAPAWRREVPGPGGAERPPTGVRDLYTWQSRRLRLHFDADGATGVVLGYGDPLHPRNRHAREPLTGWRRSLAQEKKLGGTVYLPRDHDPDRAAWRGIGALLTGQPAPGSGSGEPPGFLRPLVLEWVAQLVTEGVLPRGYLVRARTVGAQYGTQQSVIDEIVDDHVSMAVVLLHQQDRRFADQAIAAVGDADLAVNALGDLATNLARAAGLDGDGRRAAARDHAYGMFEQPYRSWLHGLAHAEEPYEQRQVWQQEVFSMALRLGERLQAAAGHGAWQGRVVDLKKGPEWFNSALADRWFRSALRKGLGIESPPTPSSVAPADSEPSPDTTVEASA